MAALPAETTVAVVNAPDETAVLVAIARLEGKVDATLAVHGADLSRLRDADADHEARIRSLERKLWIAAGGAAVLGGVLGNIAPFLATP
ncbi:hypothetical protein SEA_GARDENSTATE_22 [Microbacterium phage GardenState]|uniref:Uncharacterized protein n=1 Tax=Microbacterium phage GardenState TaxID=2776841 RepID=A0A7L8ZE88_9CAUD|nr:hypothetical protein SEA_GARDENSTATE_22 [Microbacterium phage GardenState]